MAARRYHRDEVIRIMCAIMNRQSTNRQKCIEMQQAIGDLTDEWWRLVRVPVTAIETTVPANDARAKEYAARRQQGEAFPPVVLDDYIPGRPCYPYDGHHRVRAAKIAGDIVMAAFVPADRVQSASRPRRSRRSH